MFRTNLSTGLPNSVVPDLLENYGHNHLPTPPKPSVLKMLLTQILDFMVIILIIVAIVEVAMGDPDPAYVLTVVIVLNVVIGFSQEYQANKALEALSSLSVPKVRVMSLFLQLHGIVGSLTFSFSGASSSRWQNGRSRCA